MSDRLKKLHLYICIFAAVVVTAICIWRGESLYAFCVWASVTIVAFYLIGQVIRIYLTVKVFSQLEEDRQEDSSEDELSADPLQEPVYADAFESDDTP